MSLLFVTKAMAAKLPAVPKLVLIFLADCCTEDGEAWPTRARVARMAGCTEADVSHALAEFHAIGLINRVGAPVPGQPNRYRLDVDILARLTVAGQWKHLLDERGAA